MFFLLVHLFFLVHLCALYLFPFHFVFNSLHKHIHSYRSSCNSCTHSHAISHCCHVMPLFVSSFTFLSSAVGHYSSVDLGQSVSAFHSHPLQFLHELNAPTPSPMLALPRFPLRTLTARYVVALVLHLFTPHLRMNSGVRPTRNLPCHATDSYPQYATAARGGVFPFP